MAIQTQEAQDTAVVEVAVVVEVLPLEARAARVQALDLPDAEIK